MEKRIHARALIPCIRCIPWFHCIVPAKVGASLNRALAGLVLMLSVGAGLPAPAQAPPSSVFRPVLLESFAASYDYSTKADVNRAGVLGGVAVQHAELSLSGRRAFSPSLQLAYGGSYDTNRIDADAAVPLPDELSALSLNLGLIHPLDAQWTFALFARPGFYGDFAQLDGHSLNAPLLVTASYGPRRELGWTFALSFNSFARNPVLPVLGVRWQFAPEWNLAVGFPHTGVTWQSTPDLALRADISFQGGSYRITRAPAAHPTLGNTLVDYREIRAGAGFDFKLTAAATLSLDAGWVASRRFDYHERDYRLDGDAAAYVKLACSARF